MFLEINNLELKLGEFHLGPLSFSLEEGDYLVLLGPSGCGKTSLLRAVAGVYETPPGCLRLRREDIGRLSANKRKIGYVAQTAGLFPHMNVAENVAFGLKYVQSSQKEKKRTLDRIVELVNIGELLQRRPSTLSGGESRRVGLARSLAVNPQVLLLDEPLSMLDYNARAGMLEVLKMIHRELGTATIHVTHDREEAWTLESQCAVMHDGKIQQVGGVEELFRRPVSRFVSEFLGGKNIFPARFEPDGAGSRAVLEWAEFELGEAVDYVSGYVQIRPETLSLAADTGEGRIECMVRTLSDRGIYTELGAEVQGGARLHMHIAGSEAAGLEPGEKILVECRTTPHPIPQPKSS